MPFVIGNEARAMRVMEIMNDYRTLQLHINSHLSRSQSNPPDQQSSTSDGYVVLRSCLSAAQSLLSRQPDLGNLGMRSGHVDDGEVQRATLQR